MSPAFTDSARFARDPEARYPVTAGIASAAVMVMAEDPATVSHDVRIQLASRVLQSPVDSVESWLWAISTNPTVVNKWVGGDRDGAINDLAYVISTLWNAMAGIGVTA